MYSSSNKSKYAGIVTQINFLCFMLLYGGARPIATEELQSVENFSTEEHDCPIFVWPISVQLLGVMFKFNSI